MFANGFLRTAWHGRRAVEERYQPQLQESTKVNTKVSSPSSEAEPKAEAPGAPLSEPGGLDVDLLCNAGLLAVAASPLHARFQSDNTQAIDSHPARCPTMTVALARGLST